MASNAAATEMRGLQWLQLECDFGGTMSSTFFNDDRRRYHN